MVFPKLKKIVKETLCLDGGSICLYILDDTDEMHRLELVQHLIPQNSTVHRRIGRLYFDNRLIDVRSSDEVGLMNFLKTPDVHTEYEVPVKNVLAFVESD